MRQNRLEGRTPTQEMLYGRTLDTGQVRLSYLVQAKEPTHKLTVVAV